MPFFSESVNSSQISAGLYLPPFGNAAPAVDALKPFCLDYLDEDRLLIIYT